MKLKELLSVLKVRLIAYNSLNGKTVFDTGRNKNEFVNKYLECEVISIYNGADVSRYDYYGNSFKLVAKCYLSSIDIEKAEEKK